MKITELQAFLLSAPLREPLRVRFSSGELVCWKQDTMLIRARTDVGLIGYAPGPASENAAQLINRNLRSALVNADPTKIEAIRQRVLQKRPQFPGLLEAYGAVEIALLDLKGKTEGRSMSELLGGRVRDQISLYGNVGLPLDGERYGEQVSSLEGLGLEGYQFPVGFGGERDLEVIRKARAALPNRISLMLDGSAWWRLGEPKHTDLEVHRLIGEMSDCGLTWLQEPFDPRNRVAYRQLSEKSSVPIAAGRHESSPDNLISLACDGIVDVVQIDVIGKGGYLTCREIVDIAERAGVRVALENTGTALDALTMAQFGICFGERSVAWLAWPFWGDAFYFKENSSALNQEILRQPLQIESGRLVVTKTPGLGIDVNEGVISRYPWKPGAACSFRSRSPVVV